MPLTIGPIRRCRARRRIRRANRRALEARLRLYGETLRAPDEVKQRGLERLLAEEER